MELMSQQNGWKIEDDWVMPFRKNIVPDVTTMYLTQKVARNMLPLLKFQKMETMSQQNGWKTENNWVMPFRKKNQEVPDMTTMYLNQNLVETPPPFKGKFQKMETMSQQNGRRTEDNWVMPFQKKPKVTDVTTMYLTQNFAGDTAPL